MTPSASTSHIRLILRLRPVGDLPVRAADQRVGLDADAAQRGDRVLGRLGLQLARRRDVGHQRDVQEEAVVPADLVPDLAGGLEEGQRLDVADGAADLGDDHVDRSRPGRRLGAGQDPGLDLVGDVRDDLHGVAEVLPAPLLGDHVGVDLAGGHVGPAGEVGVQEALVVPDVQVGLGAVLGDEDLAVLERVHRPGVDVEVGVQLLHRDPQAAAGQQRPQRARGQSLAEGGDDAAGDEDELRRLGVVQEAADSTIRFQTVDPRETTVTRRSPTGPGAERHRPSPPDRCPAPAPRPARPAAAPAAWPRWPGPPPRSRSTAAPSARLSAHGQQAGPQHRGRPAAGRPPGRTARAGCAAARRAAAATPRRPAATGSVQASGLPSRMSRLACGLAADHRPGLAVQHLLDEPARGGCARTAAGSSPARRPRRRRPPPQPRTTTSRTTVTRMPRQQHGQQQEARAARPARRRSPGPAPGAPMSADGEDADAEHGDQRTSPRRSAPGPGAADPAVAAAAVSSSALTDISPKRQVAVTR